MSVSQGVGAGQRLSRGGRAAALFAAAVSLSACSTETSRFDYPVFGGAQAYREDTTAALPVPSQPVYGGTALPAASDAVERYPAPAQQASYSPPSQEGAPTVGRSAPPPRAQSLPAPAPVTAREPAATAQPPAPATVNHTVSRGDTLSAIALKHGVTVDELKAANGLSSTRLSIGQVLVVPSASGSPSAVAAAPARDYTVERGDSLYAIARRHDVDHRELARFNGLSLATTLQPGQVLKIPAVGPTAVAARDAGPTNASGVRVVRTRPISASGQEEAKPVRVAASGPVTPVPTPAPARREEGQKTDSGEAKVAALPQPEPMTGNEFRWPARGRIISGFGAKPNGTHNDGINIAVPLGTSVKAVENGVVAYAGNELEGYGNLVLIRHANNWVSAYAHNDELLVKRGDTVRRGQIIAKAGQTGSVTQPQLHFELRKGSKPVDPVQYMAAN